MTTRMHDRLVNWGRYWRDHGGDFNRCRSLEHKYLREYDDHAKSLLAAEAAQERVASRPPAPDMHDALLVNEAWKRCEPKVHKPLLKWSFCMGRISDQTVCNRCGIQLQALPLRYARAVREISRILDTPNFIDTIAPDNSRNRPDKDIPAQTENLTAHGAAQVRPREPEQVD